MINDTLICKRYVVKFVIFLASNFHRQPFETENKGLGNVHDFNPLQNLQHAISLKCPLLHT